MSVVCVACHVFPNVHLRGWGCAWERACADLTLSPLPTLGSFSLLRVGVWRLLVHVMGPCCGSVHPNFNSRFGVLGGGENLAGCARIPARSVVGLCAQPGRSAPTGAHSWPLAGSAAASEPGPGSPNHRLLPASLGEATGAPPLQASVPQLLQRERLWAEKDLSRRAQRLGGKLCGCWGRG